MCAGSSNAESAAAVSSAQLKAQKLIQEIAVARAGFLTATPAGLPVPGLLGPLGPGPAGHMALVPVMLQNADGTYTAAYQVQPVPPAGFATDSMPAELAGGDPISRVVCNH